MKLKVLIDNNTLIDTYYYGEPGLSFYIEDNDTKILFDVGYSDVIIKNSQLMNIDLHAIDQIILSHGHSDHTWGLLSLMQYYYRKFIYELPELIGHPHAFLDKNVKNEQIGIPFSLEKLQKYFKVHRKKESLWITDNLLYLGEIRRNNDFEAKNPIGTTVIDNIETDDYIMDDTALVYRAKEGLVIITGCSHSGICNIIEYAKELCNEDRILDIIGGFHLLNPSKKQIEGTLKYFENNNVKKIHACHCTDLNSKIQLSRVVDVVEVGVGLELEYL